MKRLCMPKYSPQQIIGILSPSLSIKRLFVTAKLLCIDYQNMALFIKKRDGAGNYFPFAAQIFQRRDFLFYFFAPSLVGGDDAPFRAGVKKCGKQLRLQR